MFSNTNLVYAKSNTKQYKVSNTTLKKSAKPNNTNTNNNNLLTSNTKKGNTKQHKVSKRGTKDIRKDSTNQYKPNNTNTNNNKPTKVSYNVAYPLGFTTSKLQGNMYVDLAIGAGFGLGNAINITNTLTGTTEFAGVHNDSNGVRSGSAQDSSVSSNNLIGVNFNAGIGYELIVKTRSKVNFYTALGFSYNLLSGNGTSVSNSVNANVVNGVYYEGNFTTQRITYNSESTSTTNISQADLLHIVGAKVKLGMSMLQDRLKVYGIVGLGALLPVHVTGGNISINNNVSDGVIEDTIDSSAAIPPQIFQLQPEESLQQDYTASLNPTTTNTAFLPGGGIGISYDIVPRRLAVFFEFEGMPVINTAGAAVLNSNTFTNTGDFVNTSAQTLLNVTNTVTSNTSTTSDGLTALFMLRTGIKLGF